MHYPPPPNFSEALSPNVLASFVDWIEPWLTMQLQFVGQASSEGRSISLEHVVPRSVLELLQFVCFHICQCGTLEPQADTKESAPSLFTPLSALKLSCCVSPLVELIHIKVLFFQTLRPSGTSLMKLPLNRCSLDCDG